jgi:hypothetical protein
MSMALEEAFRGQRQVERQLEERSRSRRANDATISAVRSFSPHITFTMNAVRSANEIDEAQHGMSATHAANATQAITRAQTSGQRTFRAPRGLEHRAQRRGRATAPASTPPYHMGKNPAPGPSSLM